MAKTKKGQAKTAELDSTYLLKLVLYVVLGTLWLRVFHGRTVVPIPLGLIVGWIFAMHDHFKIDRKIEYAVLLVAMLVGFWAQIGLVISF